MLNSIKRDLIAGVIALAVLLPPAAFAYAPPICPHILGWNDEIKEWAEGAPWIKALDITSCAIAKERGARVFYRVWDHASGPDGDTGIGGKKFGEEILERLAFLPKEKWPDAISFQNEFNGVSKEAAQCFIDMYDTLREGGYEGLIIYGSYGPGGPTDMKEWGWPWVKAAAMKADGIETHEYWDLRVAHLDTWLAHRHVRSMEMYPYLRGKPWFIGEFGSDGVTPAEDPQRRSGWQDRGKLTADEYIKQIEIYRHGNDADGDEEVVPCADEVIAVFIYGQGSWQWEKWETMGTPVAKYLQTTWPPTVGYIHGVVIDASGKPVEGAKVKTSTGKTATTDQAGRYWLFALKAGDYTVSVAKSGMKGQESKATVKAGDYLVRDFKLDRIANDANQGSANRWKTLGMSRIVR